MLVVVDEWGLFNSQLFDFIKLRIGEYISCWQMMEVEPSIFLILCFLRNGRMCDGLCLKDTCIIFLLYTMVLHGLTLNILGTRPPTNNIAVHEPVADELEALSASTGLTFNVVDYGAKGDGQTDDSQAFTKAWGDACGATGDVPVFQIPLGKTFFLEPLTFNGPCKSPNIQIQIQGKLVAPNTFEKWTGCEGNSWLYFSHVAGLDISGAGQLDGQGSLWWTNPKTQSTQCNRPTALHFNNCTGLQVRDITSLNSPKNHISISSCKDVELSNLHLIAPEKSPNTDGIDISKSTNVHFYHSFIGTGDDCVAINGGSSLINITDVTCGPGHGISVGSLGANGARDTVEQVLVKNCTFIGTQNGARIKTWQGGSGYAKNITFEEIILQDAKNPIIINQYYCNGHSGCHTETSAVQVSDVIYRGFRGTSASEFAINLNCSATVACTNLLFDDVKLTPFVSGKALEAYCQNADGVDKSTTPDVPCLSRS